MQQQQQNYQYQNPNQLAQPQQQVYNQRSPQSQLPPTRLPNQPPQNAYNKVTGNVDPNSMKYRLRNQLISGFAFLPNIKCSIIFSLCVGLLLAVLGIVVIIISSTVIEVDKRYDDFCDIIARGSSTTPCALKIDVTEEMSKPVYFYLGVQNFFQNHRLYVKSYSANQLYGDDIDEDTAKSKCSPIYHNSDLTSYQTTAADGSTALVPGAVANPCGLIARSIIDDEFVLTDDAGTTTIPISVENIAWSVDRDHKFKRNGRAGTRQYIDVEDERFINWMSFPTSDNWKKLWGIIDQDLPVGTYTFHIKNYYDVLGFHGEKHVILSNVTVLGGTSKLLAVLLVIMGSGYIVLAAVIAVFKWYKKISNEINTSNIEWKWD